MPIISAVGLFCCDKFEETPNEKLIIMSKLTKSYFNITISFGKCPKLKSCLNTYGAYFIRSPTEGIILQKSMFHKNVSNYTLEKKILNNSRIRTI